LSILPVFDGMFFFVTVFIGVFIMVS